MLPRLLALDLDGTLLPRDKVLTPRTIAAVRAAAEAGTQVVLATGKALHLTEEYAGTLELDGPVIALDGCLVRDGGGKGILSRTAIPTATAGEALERLASVALRPFLVDGADRLVIHEHLADWEWFLKVYARRRALSAAPLDDADGDPFFLAFMGDPEAMRAGEEAIRPLARNGLMLFTYEFVNWPLGMVVLRPQVTKGDALELVAGRAGISRADVTAVGDWRNDVTMIDWAGTGAAMPRSAPEVMEVADLVLPTGCEDDGVAEYLEELLGRS
jgi:hypothetical protein